ncbi:MAG: Non-canonical purine NTP pyrophosphatase, partial [Microgenomates group bacterium GW2011_GWD1_47_13]
DALHGEPGIKVRRWKGYSMTDEEIISYTLERLHGVSSAQRGAQFRTVIAVSYKHHSTRTFSGIYRGVIRTQPLVTREAGFPFRSLFRGSHPTHRENAAKSVLPYLSTLMN